jgi:predicted regulator of Ras-like GTPase activity (Roadblock/LC7/MglB family)
MNYPQVDLATAQPLTLDDLLLTLHEQGQFEAAVLASGEGLPIATVPANFDTDKAAAMMAMLKRVSKEARDQFPLAEIDEFSILDSNRMRLVCRYIKAGGEEVILAIIAPPDQSYRRMTNLAIKQIVEFLS